jgi:hypothetical protein
VSIESDLGLFRYSAPQEPRRGVAGPQQSSLRLMVMVMEPSCLESAKCLHRLLLGWEANSPSRLRAGGLARSGYGLGVPPVGEAPSPDKPKPIHLDPSPPLSPLKGGIEVNQTTPRTVLSGWRIEAVGHFSQSCWS